MNIWRYGTMVGKTHQLYFCPMQSLGTLNTFYLLKPFYLQESRILSDIFNWFCISSNTPSCLFEIIRQVVSHGSNCWKVEEMFRFLFHFICRSSADCVRLWRVPFHLGLVDCSHFFHGNYGTTGWIFMCPPRNGRHSSLTAIKENEFYLWYGERHGRHFLSSAVSYPTHVRHWRTQVLIAMGW